VLRIDHDPSRRDDRAITVALAAHKLTEQVWMQHQPPLRMEFATVGERLTHEVWQRVAKEDANPVLPWELDRFGGKYE
jgi:hypothetical protein